MIDINKERKIRGYWTYDKCKEEIIKYLTPAELKKKNRVVYNKILNNGWDELFDMLSPRKKYKHWDNYHDCLLEASKYSSIYELVQNSCACYNSIRKNKWFDLLEPIRIDKPRNYWSSKELCQLEALKYTNKSDFQNYSSGAYHSSKNNGWYEEICQHMITKGSLNKRMIYAYEFEDRSVYVGLTYDITKRNSEHFKNDKSAVYIHYEKIKISPKLIHISDYINVDDAIQLEHTTVDEYRKNGWNILNRAKTGCLGGSNIKWNSDTLKSEALNYKTRTLFKINSGGAYKAAIAIGILDEVCVHMTSGKHKTGY